MERQMRIHEDVVRYLSITREAFAKGPSAIIDKNVENESYAPREEEAA
jgi:ribosomal protein S6